MTLFIEKIDSIYFKNNNLNIMELYKPVPQKEYLIEGIPARTYGEWPGIKPNHWRGSLRVIHPNQTQKIFDRDSYVPLLGRRHFSEVLSKEAQFKPARKVFNEKKYQTNIEDKPCGLKKVNLPNSVTKIQFDKRHYEPRYGIENDPEILHIRTYRPDGNTRTIVETPIEKEFGIKKKLWSLTERRNGMGLYVPGDKSYKASEHISNFFKEGGLIVGSTNVMNYNKTQSKKANNFYETLDLNMKTLDRAKIWKNKVKKEQLDYDSKYVKTLTEWEKNMFGENEKNNEKEKVAETKGKAVKGKEVNNKKGKASAKGKK